MGSCPNCGSSGIDLVFAFYCDNPSCKNYKVQKLDEKDISNEGFLPCTLCIQKLTLHPLESKDTTIILTCSMHTAEFDRKTDILLYSRLMLYFSWKDDIQTIPAFTHFPEKKLFTTAGYQWFTIVGNIMHFAKSVSSTDKSAQLKKSVHYRLCDIPKSVISEAIYKPSLHEHLISIKIKDCFNNEYVQLFNTKHYEVLSNIKLRHLADSILYQK